MVHTIPTSVMERECLEQFAALTRHGPNALLHGWKCSFGADGEDVTIALQFGGARKALRTIPAADLLDSIVDFSNKHAKPLARELLDSRGCGHG